MRYTLAIILLSIVSTFAQEQVVDTIYTDTHKVTYVTDSFQTNTPDSKSDSNITKSSVPNDTFGLSAPPEKINRVSVLLIAQILSFTLSYEHLLSDFWSLSLRFGYAGFSKKDIISNTNAEGTIYTFAAPIALRWIWGRRNLGKYHYIDASGNNVYRNKSQIEGFLQVQLAPIQYSLDLHRDSSSYSSKLNIKEKEYALFYTVGFGFNLIYEHFFFGPEINIGSFIRNPKFQDQITVYQSRYGTRLLNKLIAESVISIGWAF